MGTLALKLSEIAGSGKLAEREYRVRSALNWRTKAKSSIRHLLHGEQTPTLDEAKEIEAAHLKYCAQKVEANRYENERLFTVMQQSIAAMQASDPEFYRPHIEALGALLLRGRNLGR